jgi:hypothetical protein
MTQTRLIFERQWLHAWLLAVLLTGMVRIAGYDGVRHGQLLGVATPVWFWLGVGLAITHQVYVWICWRLQLHASWLTRLRTGEYLGFAATACTSSGSSSSGRLPSGGRRWQH